MSVGWSNLSKFTYCKACKKEQVNKGKATGEGCGSASSRPYAGCVSGESLLKGTTVIRKQRHILSGRNHNGKQVRLGIHRP